MQGKTNAYEKDDVIQGETHAKNWKVWFVAGKKITWLKDFNHITDSDGYDNLPVLSCKAIIQWRDYFLNKYVCIYVLHIRFQYLGHPYFSHVCLYKLRLLKKLVSFCSMHCNENPCMNSFSGNCAASVPIHTFMYLWAINISHERSTYFAAAN